MSQGLLLGVGPGRRKCGTGASRSTTGVWGLEASKRPWNSPPSRTYQNPILDA
jgi:hypothetical protein